VVTLVAVGICTLWADLASTELAESGLANAGLGLFALTTIAIWLIENRTEVTYARMLLWAAPFDLVSIVMLGVAFHAFEDPAYPLLVAMPLFYGLVVRRTDTWVISLATAFAYLVIHLGDPHPHLLGLAIIVLKAAMIVYVGVVAAFFSSASRKRERLLQKATEEKERLNEQLQRRLADLQAISRITEVVHSSLDFERVGQHVLDILAEVIESPECCLFIIDKDKGETLFSASVGMPEPPAAGAVPGAVAGEEATLPDTHLTCTPLFDHGGMLVVFCAASPTLEGLSDDDRLVLSAVASELAVAAENSRLYHLTKRLAVTDELTGLHNYRFFQQRLHDELDRARRYDKDLSLLMIDVDNFKGFNDAHGHVAGDVALREVGDVMRRSVREVDVVCRYGGEEFAVLLPETDPAGAFVVAEKMREAVSRFGFANTDGERTENLTISVGLASYPMHADDRETLLRHADGALYRAKHSGKDRVRSPESRAGGYNVATAVQQGS
jgi:diguanylate cyclase (GGDEF)-like protein